jgi:nucleoside-diphosphate-sugar epimerase
MLEHLNATPKAPSRVVVIGAKGFVGGAVVARLANERIPPLALSRGEVDLLQPGAAQKLAGLLRPTDSVVAVSALAPVKNTRMLADNMTMVLAMVEALAKSPVAHVVNISSDAIYADGPLPLDEGSPAAPASLHGAMHVARELAFRAEVKAPQAHLRPTLIYGTSDPHNGYGPNRFRRLAAEGKDIVLFGEGEERRDHVYVEDVAEIVVRALQHKSVGALNIATGEVHSFRDLAERAVAISGKRSAIKGSPRSGPMPHGGYRPFDVAATRKAFPDFAYTGVAEGMKKSAATA